jgi:hypothetical protein
MLPSLSRQDVEVLIERTAMAFSSVSVVTNSLSMRRYRLRDTFHQGVLKSLSKLPDFSVIARLDRAIYVSCHCERSEAISFDSSSVTNVEIASSLTAPRKDKGLSLDHPVKPDDDINDTPKPPAFQYP